MLTSEKIKKTVMHKMIIPTSGGPYQNNNTCQNNHNMMGFFVSLLPFHYS